MSAYHNSFYPRIYCSMVFWQKFCIFIQYNIIYYNNDNIISYNFHKHHCSHMLVWSHALRLFKGVMTGCEGSDYLSCLLSGYWIIHILMGEQAASNDSFCSMDDAFMSNLLPCGEHLLIYENIKTSQGFWADYTAPLWLYTPVYLTYRWHGTGHYDPCLREWPRSCR